MNPFRLTFLGLLLSSYLTGGDWPRMLGPDGNGKSTETGISLNWPTTGPPLRWHVPMGAGYASVVVAGDFAFAFDREGDQARLRCLQRETGKHVWTSTYPTAYEDMYGFSNGPRAAPLIDGERVYTYGAEGRMRCLNIKDGKLLWERDLTADYHVVQNFFGVGSTPVIHKNLLIAMVGGSPADSPKISSGKVQGNGSGIVAFNKLTGEEVYRFSDELASYAAPLITTREGRPFGLALTRGGLLGFDPEKGKQHFHFPYRAKKLESVNAATPVVIDDRVFLTESYEPGAAMLRFDTKGYEVIWRDPRRNQAMASHWATPVHHEGYLYGCHGSSSGNAELRCISLSGEVMWSKSGLRRTSLVYMDGHLIVLGEYGQLHLIKATHEGYQEVASTELKLPDKNENLLKFPAWNAPVPAHGLLYLQGADRLVCLDLMPAGK